MLVLEVSEDEGAPRLVLLPFLLLLALRLFLVLLLLSLSLLLLLLLLLVRALLLPLLAPLLLARLLEKLDLLMRPLERAASASSGATITARSGADSDSAFAKATCGFPACLPTGAASLLEA